MPSVFKPWQVSKRAKAKNQAKRSFSVHVYNRAQFRAISERRNTEDPPRGSLIAFSSIRTAQLEIFFESGVWTDPNLSLLSLSISLSLKPCLAHAAVGRDCSLCPLVPYWGQLYYVTSP